MKHKKPVAFFISFAIVVQLTVLYEYARISTSVRVASVRFVLQLPCSSVYSPYFLSPSFIRFASISRRDEVRAGTRIASYNNVVVRAGIYIYIYIYILQVRLAH